MSVTGVLFIWPWKNKDGHIPIGIDTAPTKFFKRFDKDKSGDMNAKELERMIRVSLKINEKELSSADVKTLIAALDDDGSGSVSLEELGDFVEHGSKTFYADADAAAEADGGKKTAKWGEKDEPEEMKRLRRETAAKKKAEKKLDETLMAKFQLKLQAATFGKDPQELFATFDASGDGLLSADELKGLIRRELKIPARELSDDDIAAFVAAVDDDNTGTLSLAELGDFVQHGTLTFNESADSCMLLDAARTALEPGARKTLKWGERAEECEAAVEDRKARLAKKQRPDFDPDAMRKLQGRLQAATFGKDPLEIFRKFDASGDGDLDVAELTKLIRLELKISRDEIGDDLIEAFVRAIDDDGSMTLNVNELADFVKYGMDTFYADAAATAEKAGPGKKGLGWGERAADPSGAPAPTKGRGLESAESAIDPNRSEEGSMPAPSDDDGAARAPAPAEDEDMDIDDAIAFAEARLARLRARKTSLEAESPPKEIYRPSAKGDSPHALYIDGLLNDPLLRVSDCELAPALTAFRASIVAEAPNDLATATALLKLGTLLRDVAEGRVYTLTRSIETHRHALGLVATSLGEKHSAALAVRRALIETCLLLKDSGAARDEYAQIIAVQNAMDPVPKSIEDNRAALRALQRAEFRSTG